MVNQRKQNTIFVRTRHNYDSYTDYWRLVALSDFPICYVDEIDPNSGDLYIVSPFNGEWFQVAEQWKFPNTRAKSKFVLWNLERPSGSGGLDEYIRSNQEMIDERLFDRVAVADRRLSKDTGFDFMALGSHPDLGVRGRIAKTHDIIHLSCYSNHRSFLFDAPSKPKKRLWQFSVASNGWGDYRHNALMSSRAMLCVHQDEYQYIEPLRYALAVAYGLPLIAEWSRDTFPYNGSGIFPWTSEADLKHVLEWTLDNYQLTAGLAYQMSVKIMTQFTFKMCVMSYVREHFPVVGL